MTRVAQLRRLAGRLRDRARGLIEGKVDIVFRNCEGIDNWNFVLPYRSHPPGVSAMLRVKNESNKIELCLSSIMHVFDEIVVIDNGSTDGTLKILRQFKSDHDHRDIVRILTYPHRVSRCGPEHDRTPADSVHSLVYYYNWCLSHCTHAQVFKWDADMVVAKEKGHALQQCLAVLAEREPALWRVPLQTIYRSSTGQWYTTADDINAEVMVFPNTPVIRYLKARHFEVLRAHTGISEYTAPVEPGWIFELRDTGEDEFSHWSTTAFPSERKQREWTHFQRVLSGDAAEPTFFPVAQEQLPVPLGT